MNLENRRIRLTADEATGTITGLLDKEKNREYIAGGIASQPFRVAYTDGMQSVPFAFSAAKAENALSLSWRMTGAVMNAKIVLLEDGVSFRASLQNDPNSFVKAFEYPILGPLTDYGANGFVAHSYATGVLMRDPLSFLEETGGLRYAPYPESFSGASMQFFTYYEEGKGGLYFAAMDGEAHQKWLNVYKDNGGLAVSHMTGFENAASGTSIAMTYDFVIRLTGGNGWQEAAKLYKTWALRQPWSALGTARERRGRGGLAQGKMRAIAPSASTPDMTGQTGCAATARILARLASTCWDRTGPIRPRPSAGGFPEICATGFQRSSTRIR